MPPSSNTPSTVMILYIRCLFAYTSLSQISALGKEGMDRVWSMKVLVVGMRALGVEVAKCFCMSGVELVTVYDDEVVEGRELGSNFCLRPGDEGGLRGPSVSPRLQQLNPDCTVKVRGERGEGTDVQAGLWYKSRFRRGETCDGRVGHARMPSLDPPSWHTCAGRRLSDTSFCFALTCTCALPTL